MGIANIINNSTTTSGGEIVRELVNSSDGAGLHFDGAGNIDVASPPDLGTKFTFEFVIKADSWGASDPYIVDFSNGGRFIFGSTSSQSYNLGIYDNSGSWGNFGVKVLDDLKVHHLVVTVDGTAAVLYDNGNQVGTQTISASHGLDSCSDLVICNDPFKGTLYRTRFYNKTLSSAEVQTAYERADVDFADQYGSQTNKFASPDTNWGTNAADATAFNAAYAWTSYQTSAIAVSSNVLTFTTAADKRGMFANYSLTAGKRYRVTLATGAISGATYQLMTRTGSDYTSIGTLAASTTNVFDYTAPAGAYSGYLYLYQSGSGSGSIALTAASVTNELVQTGAVVDMDLAFANPTQSRMVQDRAGAADGTASASGVTQVQPIIQGNMRSLAVTTSQQAAGVPADGEIIATKGSFVKSNSAGDVTSLQLRNGATATSTSTSLRFVNSTVATATAGGAEITSIRNANDGGSLVIKTAADTTATLTEQMRISSTGAVTFTSNAATDQFIITNADASSTSAPDLILYRNSASPADSDNLGLVQFRGKNDAAESINYGSILGSATDVSDGNEDSKLTFYTYKAGTETETLTLESGLATFSNGIAFGSQTNTSATGAAVATNGTILDHYEEGTWTPVVVGGTMVISVTSSGKQARYTRIGDLVFVQCFCDITSAGDSTALQIEGLPFSAGSGDYAFIGVNASGTTVTNPYARVQSGNDHIDFFKNAQTGMPQSEFGSGNLIFSGCYNVG